MRIKFTGRVGDTFFYAFVGVLFYALSCQYILVADDIPFARSGGGNGELIRSYADALASQAAQYISTEDRGGARFLVYSFVQYFCSVYTQKTAYFVLCSLFFVSLNVGLLSLLRRLRGRSPGDKQVILALLFFFAPDWGMSFTGIVAYAVNYLWSAALNVLLLNIFLFVGRKKVAGGLGKPAQAALFLLSLAVGSLQESFSIPACAALALYALPRRKRLSRAELVMVAGYAAGTLAILLAPQNLARFLNANASAAIPFADKATDAFRRITADNVSLWLLAVAGCVMALIKRHSLKRLDTWRIYALSVVAVSLCFALFVSYTPACTRQFVCLSLALFLLLADALYSFGLTQSVLWKRFAPVALSLIMIYGYAKVYDARQCLYDAYGTFTESVLTRPDSVAVYKDLSRVRNVTLANRKWEAKYTCDYLAHLTATDAQWLLSYSHLLNGFQAQNHKTVSLPAPPEEIVGGCVPANSIGNQVYKTEDGYYIVKAPADAPRDSVKIALSYMRADFFPFTEPFASHKIHHTTISASNADKGIAWERHRYYILHDWHAVTPYKCVGADVVR